MLWRERLLVLCKAPDIAWLDLIILASLFLGGALYLNNPLDWGIAWIGNSQYGDAEFWWNGALHVAEGLFRDNPGNGFRPGYFFLTGLTLPILGKQFQQFYPYFLAVFFSASSLFYLALSQLLGRWIAACAVGCLIFNPYTAEWLATSTTDGTGILLNLLALSCLLFGVNKQLNLKWLISFSFLFSLATLTRPLLAPFIGVVLVFIFFASTKPFKKRLSIVFCVFAAFCVPLLLWMCVQKLTIDRWSLSSNDASEFYAASDPAIQVWNNSMYSDAQKIAAEHYSVPLHKVNDQMLNDIFWRETIKNYLKYPSYHIKRALPHLFRIALFNPSNATHGTLFWRIALFEGIILSLAIWLFMRRRFYLGYIFTFLGISVFFIPKLITIMILGGVVFGVMKKGTNTQPGIFFLAMYWLTGVAALYLVGGSWEVGSSQRVALNALGYRLGSQIFFIGDILAAYFLIYLAQVDVTKKVTLSSKRWQTLLTQSNPLAGLIVKGGFIALCLISITVYLMGGSIVAYRVYSRTHTSNKIEPYPSASLVMKSYQDHTGKKLLTATNQLGGIDPQIFSINSLNTSKYDVIFTGVVSPFVWSLPGQKRTQMMIYAQSNISPFTMGPGRVFVEIPERIKPADWIGKQGAFVIQNIPDSHNTSNLPYYLTVPALRAFTPVASDHHSFALSETTWFPLTKNATQLETNGELQTPATSVTWSLDSGTTHFQRRFFMTPQINKPFDNSVRLHLNTSANKGPMILSFSYAVGTNPEIKQAQTNQKYYDITISEISGAFSDSVKKILYAKKPLPMIGQKDVIKKIKIAIPAKTKAIEIIFNKLVANTGVWVYEFNLSAADLKPLAAKTTSF